MPAIALDHVTIRTTDLNATVSFYRHFLALRPGFRPAFSMGGAWLYAEDGDYPILHVIATDRLETGMRDHVAFRVSGLNAYLDKVKASGAPYLATALPDTDIVQFFVTGPEGLKIELQCR